MKIKSIMGYAIVALTVVGLAGCGGSSSPAAAAGGDTVGTAADVSNLTTLPTSDLSAYDTTESATANLSAAAKSLTAKEVPGALGAGKLCRACCEAHMQKKQIFRSSVMAQQMRCIAEAFQKAGLITAGTDAYNIYSITPPTDAVMDPTNKRCADIPIERDDEKIACESGNEGPKGGVKMRLGVFGGNELRVDICKLHPTLERQDEGIYTLSGETATTAVVHKGNFGGELEKMRLSQTITGMTGIDADTLVPTLKSSGLAEATASMDGRFGSGTIAFKRSASDSSITVSGAFAGKVHEYNSGTDTTFEGKAYAQGGGDTNTVVAKFEFTGAPPPMKLSKMIPFDIPLLQLENFLQVMSSQFGFDVNEQNYTTLFVCPNKDFKPELATQTVKPMVLAVLGSNLKYECPTMTHSGIECGTITNGTEDSGFTGKKITQTFTSVVCTPETPFWATVNAFKLNTLTASLATPIDFTRAWDCSGTATALDFLTLTQTQGQTLQTYMQKCNALEEKGRGNSGMGEYDCSSKDGANAINDVKKEPPNNGALGGPYSQTAGGTCVGATLPDKFFISPVNPTENKYCLPDNNGGCVEFTAAGSPVAVSIPVNIGGSDITISQLAFSGGNPPTDLSVTWGACTQLYTKDTLGGFSAPPTTPTSFPAECTAKGLTTPQTCGDYCQSHTCSAPQ